MIYCCEEHVDIALDDIVDEFDDISGIIKSRWG